MQNVLFLGSKGLGLKAVKEMYAIAPESLRGVITIDDSSDTRSAYSGFRDFERETRLDLHIAKNGKSAEAIIAEHKPDLCIVVGWYWLISEATLSSVRQGFVGIHNSLLPKLRGGSPLVWSIILEHKEVGCSLFSFTPGLDDGPIWAQGSVPLDDDDYVSDALAKVEQKAIDLFRHNYPLILAGTLSPMEQDHSLATFCAQRMPSDGSIRWDQSARAIYNFIRAQSHPYPGAYTFLKSDKLSIWRARLCPYPYFGTPGQIARISEDGVCVVCGDNMAIIIEEVEDNASKRGKAQDFIKSVTGRLSHSAVDDWTYYDHAARNPSSPASSAVKNASQRTL